MGERPGGHLARVATTLLLDLVALKPLATFVWWFSQRANTIQFDRCRELRRLIERTLAEGRPVLVASNHVSWFDDPVIPMALYRTGERAARELLLLLALAGACWLLPAQVLPAPAAVALVAGAATASALAGARKVWWTLGALENLSDASVLRGKLALTRKAPPGPLLRAWLRAADVLIPWFMHSGSVRTIMVDRRPGEEARQARARGIAAALDVAARPEPVWIFFEGGRTKRPGEIAPARRGVGSLVTGLVERDHDPLVVVLYHEGMERLIPPGGARLLSRGHEVRVRWSLFDVLGSKGVAEGDAQAVADAVRDETLALQARLRAAAREAEAGAA